MIEGQYYGGNISTPVESMECRPDPEAMLQRCRKRIVACDDAEALLIKLAEIPVHINFGSGNDNAFNCALGSVVSYRHRLRKEEVEWLAEIDKG